jgi:rRNA maturation RNase YbeY
LLNINKTFLHHDTYTDIITFDYPDNGGEGEILISIERVKENALKYKEPFPKELHRTIIHGILHLCGYKDKNAKDKKMMRAKEEEYLNMLF